MSNNQSNRNMNHSAKVAASVVVATSSLAAVAGAPVSQSSQKPFDNYVVDRFADIEVLRYDVPGFEDLSQRQRLFVYYLTEAALAGRDILWDQNCRYNLAIRDLLEDVYANYKGDRNDPQFRGFEKYLKQVEFANGIHHHYSMDKFMPEFTPEFLSAQVDKLPRRPENLSELMRVIFEPSYMAKRVNQAEGQDLIATSANNLYGRS